ncbi:uncharacterized protein H6S33_009459 [Morchella sextelata]|uniref:uncharacterized protein n=1 Tax=Morchella sextelata TaxID=1174677 RepID=UPI001D03B405|nr:uncharacterized protein H6S33_009459 [Morchella sextelata]KAH0613079.1 hypothetical protein H6S33_009459 [Morchella sextelata]
MLLRYALDVAPLWNSSEEFTEALNLLPAPIRPSVTKFYFPADRKLALGSQLLQRFVVSRVYSNGRPSADIPTLSSISITRDAESGRPSYHNPAELLEKGNGLVLRDYNVSHHNPKSNSDSTPCLVILVARVTVATLSSPPLRVGVDLVPTIHNRGNTSAADFLETFRDSDVFTKNEIRAIYSPPLEGDRVKMMYLHWALKEAYCKAVGTGLVTNLLAIDFRHVELDKVEQGERDTQVKVFVDGTQRDEWMLEIGKLSGDHYVAIATDSWSDEEEAEETGKWSWIDFGKDILGIWS